MKSVQFSEQESECGRGGSVGGDGRCLWSIFGGVWCQWIRGRQEKALDLTVVSKVVWEFTGRMDELVWTSIVTNMNITYKMPHASTKIYSYIYSMYVCTGRTPKIKRGWKKKKKKQRRRTVRSAREVFGDNLEWSEFWRKSSVDREAGINSTTPQLRSIQTKWKQQSSGSTETVRHWKKRSHLPSQWERTIDCDANVGPQLA